MNCEIPYDQACYRKGRGIRGEITNIRWIINKAREFQRNIYFCFIDYAKAFVFVDNDKVWKILKVMGIPDHLTCLLRKLNTGQEATVRTWHRKTDWLQIGKEVCKGCILSSCLFKLYAKRSWKMIMGNDHGVDEVKSGLMIDKRNINNLRLWRWHQPMVKWRRKWRGTEEPLDDSERGEW